MATGDELQNLPEGAEEAGAVGETEPAPEQEPAPLAADLVKAVAPQPEEKPEVAEPAPEETPPTEAVDLTSLPQFKEWQSSIDRQLQETRDETSRYRRLAEDAQDKVATQGMSTTDAELYLAKAATTRAVAERDAMESQIKERDELTWWAYDIAESTGGVVNPAELDPRTGVNGMIRQANRLLVERLAAKAGVKLPTQAAKPGPAAPSAASPASSGKDETSALAEDRAALREEIRKEVKTGGVSVDTWERFAKK